MRSLIHDFAQARQHHLRPGTLEEYLRLLRPFNGLQATTLTRRQVAGLVEPLPRGTGRNALAALSTVCKWAVSTRRLDQARKGSRSRPLRAKDTHQINRCD
jgi:hypothetical protein